jgi:serine/threonine protein kinase
MLPYHLFCYICKYYTYKICCVLVVLEILEIWSSEYTPMTDAYLHCMRCLAELAFSTKSSMESDVYSYGVVLLELLTRRTAVDPLFPDSTDIVGWVSSVLNGTDKIEAVCDPALMEEVFGTVEMEEVRKVLSVALRCAAREVSQRPSMTAVVKELTDARPASASSSAYWQ